MNSLIKAELGPLPSTTEIPLRKRFQLGFRPSQCGCPPQLPSPALVQAAFVVAADSVGGFVEHDSYFLRLFIPLISHCAAAEGRGSRLMVEIRE